MADEPRRSGRATKGQHTKKDDTETDSTPQPKTKSKGSKKTVEEAEDVIRCLCGNDDDDDSRDFIACDGCGVWQHNECMGLPKKYNPPEYYCEQCRPEDHPRIMEALRQGDSAEVVAEKMRGSRKMATRPKPSRQSQAAASEEASSPGVESGARPSPARAEPLKRKQREDDSETPAQPTKMRKPSGQAAETTKSKRKPANAAPESAKPASSIAEIQNPSRKATATALKNKFVGLVKEATSSSKYRIPDGETAESLGERYGILVEAATFTKHCTTNPPDFGGPYKTQFLAINSNIGKNMTLFSSLLSGSLTPEALSTMSPADMASEEHRKRDAQIKAENEKQAMLVQDDATRIRRTHKGEELVENQAGQYTNESITSTAPPRRMHSIDDTEQEQGRSGPQPSHINTSQSQSSPGRDRRSFSNFDIQNVWSNVPSPTADQHRPSYSHSANNHQTVSRQTDDADIDRLLDEDGPESAPYSPTEGGMDPSVLWRGKVEMPTAQPSQNIGSFDANAYHVAGSNLGDRSVLAAIFPKDLLVVGRIAADKADEYLTSLSAARATDVTVHSLVPAGADRSARAEFEKLFEYLLNRNRFGVFSEHNHRGHVKDNYLVPLEAGAGPVPTFLERLDYNVIQNPRPHRLLLSVFVLRWKSPPPSAQATPTAAGGPASAMSPTTPAAPSSLPTRVPHAGPAMSPTDGQRPPSQTPQHASMSAFQFPDNPYQTGQPQYPTASPLDVARSILGPYFDCYVAQSLLSSGQEIAPPLLQNLRRLFDEHPETQSDMQAFYRRLDDQKTGT